MTVDARVLELLRCPSCRAPVRLLSGGEGLACDGCRRVYPILEGIPIMLAEESHPL